VDVAFEFLLREPAVGIQVVVASWT